MNQKMNQKSFLVIFN